MKGKCLAERVIEEKCREHCVDGPKRKATGRDRDLRKKSNGEKWEIRGTCQRFL